MYNNSWHGGLRESAPKRSLPFPFVLIQCRKYPARVSIHLKMAPNFERTTVVQFTWRITRWAIAGVLIAVCLLNIPSYLLELKFLSLLKERAYGDSYILYDIQHFENTGVVYRDLDQP